MMIWICAWLIYTYSVKSAARDVTVHEVLPILSELFSEAYDLESQLQDLSKNPDTLLGETVNFSKRLDDQFLNYFDKGLTNALLELPVQSEDGYPDYGVYSINPVTNEYECESNCPQGRGKNNKKFDYIKLQSLLNYVKTDVKDTIDEALITAAINQAPLIKGIFVNRIDGVFSSSDNDFVVMKTISGQSCKDNSTGIVKHSSDMSLVGKNRANPTVKNWTTQSSKWSLFSQKLNTESRYETNCTFIGSNNDGLSLWFRLHYEIKPPLYILSSGYGRIVYLVWLIFAIMCITILRQGRRGAFELERHPKSLETKETRQKNIKSHTGSQNIPAAPIKTTREKKVADESAFNPFPVGDYDYPSSTEKTNNKTADEYEKVVDSGPANRRKYDGMKDMITTSGIGYVALAATIFYFISGSF